MKSVARNDIQMEKLIHSNNKFPISEFLDCYDLVPNRCFTSHWHPELELHVVLEGSVEYLISGTHYIVNKGSGLYIAPEAVHAVKALEEGSLSYNLVLSSRFMIDLMESIGHPEFSQALTIKEPKAAEISPSRKEGFTILGLLRKIYQTESSLYAYDLFLLGKVIEIWRNLRILLPSMPENTPDRRVSVNEKRMKTMIKYIHDNYRQPITTQEISGSASISKSECYRCFTDMSMMSPMDYVNHYRLEKAAELLSTEDSDISEICFEVGFNNTSYFAKKFRAQYGMSPKDYRKTR